MASQGVGAQLAGALVEVFLIGIVAYGFWELLEIMANRQIAIERAALGLDDESEEQLEGEGGQGGTRLGTVMPLVRRTGQVLIAALALLAVLGQVGVNVTPLLAGAGIVGVAIGFGAQALVKDIISGVFFLIDDAFRRGEYIDIGTVKGTVEKISIRSMQLRHHNGPLNTVPFGEIRHLKVFARIRELFERENIKFAHREVTVRIADHEAGKPLGEAEKEAAAAAARSVVEQRESEAAAPRDDR